MKAEKQLLIDDLLAKLEESPYLFVADYKGLKVAHLAELRKRLKTVGARARVRKNTLIKRALKAANLPELGEVLAGQTLVISGGKEAPAAAKMLKNFTAEFQKPAMRGGLLDGRPLTPAEIASLADLPSRDQLLGMLLGVINAPATKLARVLNEPAASLARVIKAKADKDQA
jgi:large subunit ribosomal protein L10